MTMWNLLFVFVLKVRVIYSRNLHVCLHLGSAASLPLQSDPCEISISCCGILTSSAGIVSKLL